MKLKILGTGSAIPSLMRLSSSYLLMTGGGTILIDTGPSVVRRLLEAGFHVNDVDVIALTHFHPDHTVDLATFLFVAAYGEPRREKHLLLTGGPGLPLFYRRLARLYRWVTPGGYDLTVTPLSKETLRLGGVSIDAARTAHNPESVALRIEEGGRSVVFTGDTDYSPALVRLASGVNLLVAECSFPQKKVKGHLNLETLEKMVGEARPEQVILSHLYPEWDRFRGVLHAPLLLGEDGMEVEV